MKQSTSWILHFILFLIFGALFFEAGRLGIIGVIVAALLIEIDQALSWQKEKTWEWFIKLDTIMDISFGVVGGIVGIYIKSKILP